MKKITDSNKKIIKEFILSELKNIDCLPIKKIFNKFKDKLGCNSLPIFRKLLSSVMEDMPEIEARKGRNGGLAFKNKKPKNNKYNKPYLSTIEKSVPKIEKKIQDLWIGKRHYLINMTDGQIRTLLNQVMKVKENPNGHISYNDVRYGVDSFNDIQYEMLDRFLVYMLGARVVVAFIEK